MDPNSMETYFGLIKTPHDALIIFEGKFLLFHSLSFVSLPAAESLHSCHVGIISRVHRRLSDIERQSVRSGSVYCFDEREAGMRRWTDGKSWSPSRVTGSFLTYRELEDTPAANTGSKNVYRADGLLKQSFSITTSDNKKLHLISYYTNEDVSSERIFETPSRDPRFTNIVIPRGIYPETSADSHAHAHSSPSPPTPHRSRHRPHHRAFQKDDDLSTRPSHHRNESGSSSHSAGGHRRSNSNSLKDHRYSPIHTTEGRSRSNSHNLTHPGFYASRPEQMFRYKSSSPSASTFPTPPPNAYSPTGSWASDDEQPLVIDAITPESIDSSDNSVTPIMIPALRDLPLHQSFNTKSSEPYTPTSATPNEQDSLSVLANLATDTLLLPKLEPKEISRERVRWVEDDRQLRALSSMLRL
ncbi:hypothetical protein BGZ81_002379 [Podila clonocystis]|nr:hypothetical protein BGZ81_002379 [Podila clonocystis]